MLTAKRMGLLLLVAPLAAVVPAADVPKGWHEFVSTQGGYIAYYPEDWHVLVTNLPTLYIATFRPSDAVRAVVVPENGATLSIAPTAAGITLIDQWISRGAVGHRIQSRRSFTLQRTAPGPPLQVAEVTFGSIDGPDTVSWCFDLAGHLLVANLSFWKGDPNETKYGEVLRSMIRVITPTGR